MTRQTLYLDRCLPRGITHESNTPCANQKFTKHEIRELSNFKLPEYLKQLNDAWDLIPNGQVSGVAPTNQGCPFDNCVIDGKWNPQQQALHGGPLPMLSGALASRGVPESWPYKAAAKTKWTQVGQM